jgi:hypothetical protein
VHKDSPPEENSLGFMSGGTCSGAVWYSTVKQCSSNVIFAGRSLVRVLYVMNPSQGAHIEASLNHGELHNSHQNKQRSFKWSVAQIIVIDKCGWNLLEASKK